MTESFTSAREFEALKCKCLPPFLLQAAVGVGLPSTLHKMEMVSSSVTVKSESGTISVILRGPEKYQETIDLLRSDLSVFWKKDKNLKQE